MFENVNLQEFRGITLSPADIHYHRDKIEIKTVDGKGSLNINTPNARVHSVLAKKMEIEHISDMVAKINIIPDFGFSNFVTD